MAHILTESPFFMGEYASMKGQVVCMENKNFTTGEGYPEKRTVTVLFEVFMICVCFYIHIEVMACSFLGRNAKLI